MMQFVAAFTSPLVISVANVITASLALETTRSVSFGATVQALADSVYRSKL